MKLTSRTRYGMRAMLELGLNYDKSPLQTKIIAQRQDISVKYLEQLMASLQTSGLIRGKRGTKGGYSLVKPPNMITLNEIFTCLEGPILMAECIDEKDYCDKSPDCVTRQLWAQIQGELVKMLKSITLQDLVEKAKKNKLSNYQI